MKEHSAKLPIYEYYSDMGHIQLLNSTVTEVKYIDCGPHFHPNPEGEGRMLYNPIPCVNSFSILVQYVTPHHQVRHKLEIHKLRF